MDGGANICVTGDLSTLVDTVDINPMPISVAVAGDNITSDDCCTKRGYTPLTLHDGTLYWQLCYYCANVVETIISPQAVVASSDVFTSWTQTGFKDGRPGFIRFDSTDGFLTMSLRLDYMDGLYYCTSDTYTIDPTVHTRPRVHRVVHPKPHSHLRLPSRYRPTTKSKQLESELWLLRLGLPGVYQLDHLPGNATGLPTEFDYHPFRFIDFKEQATIRKQAVQRSAHRFPTCKRRFYMDFGFLRASSTDLSHPHKAVDRVVYSYDGYTSYLLIVDEASCYVWVFLTRNKSPPLNIVDEFLKTHGLPDGGFIRTDQGGELAGSQSFLDTCGTNHYIFPNPQGLIHHPRMVLSRSTTTSLGPGSAHFFTDHAYLLNIGLMPSGTASTYTTASFTQPPSGHPSKVIMVTNQTFPALKFSAPGFASNVPGTDGRNSTTMTLLGFFLVTRLPIKM